MAVLALGEAETGRLLSDLADGLEISAINSMRSVTVAGDREGIARLGAEAAHRRIACRVLDLDFAFHSATMEPIRDGILADLAGIGSTPPVGDLVSTVTGSRVGLAALDANHWWRNICDPVRFAEAATALIADGYRIFVEIGPHPVLQPYLRDALHAAEATGRVISTLDRNRAPSDPFPAIAAQLHVAACDLSGAPWFDGSSDPRGMPLYPWQRERYWFGRTVEAVALADPPFDHGLLGFRQAGPLPSWVNHLDVALHPMLGDHRIDGVPVLPAAAILDMALAAARVRHPVAAALDVTDVEWLRPLAFAEGEARETRFALVSPEGDWQLSSRKRLADEAMTLHASGSLVAAGPESLLPSGGGAGDGRNVPGAMLYRRAARLGLDYGESFHTVIEVIVAEGGRATIGLAPPIDEAADYLIHPALLDGALQGLLALFGDEPEAAFLPRRLGRARVFAPFGRLPRRAELCLKHRGARSVAADIALYDETGGPVAELIDCWFARIESKRAMKAAEHFLRVELMPAPLGFEAPPAVLDRLGGIMSSLAEPPRDGERALLFEALIAAIALEAVRGLADLRAVSPHAAPLLGRLLALLRRFGAAATEDGLWHLVENDLPNAGELWRSLLAEAPEMAAELGRVATLRDQLPGMLRDGSSYDPPPLIAALRTAFPPIAAGKTVIAAALDAIAADWPGGRPLRICESAPTRFSDRLRRSETAVMRVAPGQPCDIAVCIDPDAAALSQVRAGLVAGGAVLVTASLPNPSPAVAPQCVLLRGRCGPAAGATSGPGERAAVRHLGRARRRRDTPAGAPLLCLRRNRRRIPADAGRAAYRQDRVGAGRQSRRRRLAAAGFRAASRRRLCRDRRDRRLRLRHGALACRKRRRSSRADRPARRRDARRGRTCRRTRRIGCERQRPRRRCRRRSGAQRGARRDPRPGRGDPRRDPRGGGDCRWHGRGAYVRGHRVGIPRQARRRYPARPADPRRSARPVLALFVGDDAARSAGAGRLCRRQSAARRPGAPTLRRGPAGPGDRLGPDCGCRHSRRTARGTPRARPPPWGAADAGVDSAIGAPGDGRERPPGGRPRRHEMERGAA